MRLDRRASRCAWWHAGRAAAAARERWAGFAAAAAPDKLAHRPRCCAGPGGWQPVRQSSHRALPTSPRPLARGTCGGIFKRWAGKPAHCFGREEHHPSPTPSREGRGHAHPPPARGRERGSPSERISFQGTRTGTRLVALDKESVMANVQVIQRHAHLAGAVKLEFFNGREGKIAKAVLTAISNTRRGRSEEHT